MANLQAVPAGALVWDEIARLRCNDGACLAPRFHAAIEAGIARANARGFPVKSVETCRCEELQEIYFRQGVTKASSAYRAWHIYGLADDLVHPQFGWDWYPGGRTPNPTWCNGVVQAMKADALLSWGGDWLHFQDYPHWQFIHCKPTPSDQAYELYRTGGKAAVWAAVGAA